MNREIPFFRAKADFSRVERIRRVTLGVMVVTSTLAVTVVTVTGLAMPDPVLSRALIFMAPLFGAAQLHSYLQVHLISDRQFPAMSRQQLTFAGILPLATIPLTLSHALPGFIIGQCITTILVIVFVLRSTSVDLRPLWDRRETIRLIQIGFPILAIGLLYGLLITVDRWVIAILLGVEALGHYTLAIIVLGVASLLPMTIAQQIYPRMAEAYGESSNYTRLRSWILRQAGMALAVTLPVVALIWVAGPTLVRRFLPEYVPGIAAMKILLIGVLFLPLAGSFGNFLNTVGKQRSYMLVQASSVVVSLCLSLLLLAMGYGIEGVAVGTALAFFLYSSTLCLLGVQLLRGSDLSGDAQ